MEHNKVKVDELVSNVRQGNLVFLRTAASQNYIDASSMNQTDSVSRLTPLTSALLLGDSAMASELLKLGADPNWRNSDQSTPLSIAARMHNPQLIDLLLRAGAHPDAPAGYRDSALIEAIRCGNNSAAIRLIAAGANIETGNPLVHAVRNGNSAIVQVLLERGASPEVKDERGQNAMEIARRFRDSEELCDLLTSWSARVPQRSQTSIHSSPTTRLR